MDLLTILANAFSTWPADAIDVISQNRRGELFACHPAHQAPAPFPICQADVDLDSRRFRQTQGWSGWVKIFPASSAFADTSGLFVAGAADDWPVAIITKGAWLTKRAELFPDEPMPEPDTSPEPATVVNLMDPMSIKKCIRELQAQIDSLHAQMNAKKDLCSSYHRALAELGFSLNKSSVQPPM